MVVGLDFNVFGFDEVEEGGKFLIIFENVGSWFENYVVFYNSVGVYRVDLIFLFEENGEVLDGEVLMGLLNFGVIFFYEIVVLFEDG